MMPISKLTHTTTHSFRDLVICRAHPLTNGEHGGIRAQSKQAHAHDQQHGAYQERPAARPLGPEPR